MKFVDIFKANISTIATVSATVQIILYIIGVVINIKIVLSCWTNKKHNKSWQLHILYSISCIIIFAFDIPYWLVTLCVPHLSNFTGEWICYLALFVNHFFIHFMKSTNTRASHLKSRTNRSQKHKMYVKNLQLKLSLLSLRA